MTGPLAGHTIDSIRSGLLAKKFSAEELAREALAFEFVIAGAAVAVVAPKFEAWRQTVWDNLGASFQLHRINRVIAIDHRDCGAAKIAYGPDSVATPQAETETHRKVLAEFREQMHRRHPAITVETGLMALDGSLQPLG